MSTILLRRLVCALALVAGGCSGSSAPAAFPATRTPQSASLATYEFYCSDIGLGTITALVVDNSRDDAFHVTSVEGGNGTVKPGDIIIAIAYENPGPGPSDIPGFHKNGQTTYTCPGYSGRRHVYQPVTFIVRGPHLH